MPKIAYFYIFLMQRIFIAFSLLFISGCNVFSFVDNPSGEIQILESARSCFNVGNYICAGKYYSQLSSTSSDSSNSEYSFEILAQNGMTVSTFIGAFISGNGNIGSIITKLANAFIPTSGQSTRLSVFHAYQIYSQIENIKLQGLVRFTTALALISELLSETSNGGRLHQADLVTQPSICLKAFPLFINSSACNAPQNSHLTSGPSKFTLNHASDSELSGNPNMQMIYAAIIEFDAGINQMSNNATLGSQSLSFTTKLINSIINPDPQDSPEFRGMLIYFSIGE